jgi:DNA-binding IclR family transcriptional regulator
MPDTRRAGTLSTGLDILEVLAAASDGLGVTELADRLGSDKGNVHRLLKVLQERGYVEQSEDTRRYFASVQLVALAGRLLRSPDLLEVARPVLHDVRERTGESVHLAKRNRTGGVYIAQERAAGRVGVETEIGSQPILHATATGKALLAASRDRLASLVPGPLPAFTPRTITDTHRLRLDLEQVVERGYAVDDEELILGVRCVAAPIFDMYGSTVGCVGLSGPAMRVTVEQLPHLGAVIREAAGRITAGIGGEPPMGFPRVA